MPIVGLDHVQIAMPRDREAEARAFYSGVLGLAEIAKPDQLARRGGVWFHAGDRELHLGVEEEFRPARKAHPAFRVEDLNALRAALTRAAYRLVEDDSLPGFDRFYVSDPFGNRLEFLEPLRQAGDPAADAQFRG